MMRSGVLLAAGIAVLIVWALAACQRQWPEIIAPDNRIQHFIGQVKPLMRSQEKYQEFIEHELGNGFTEQDFATYMERNDAECARDIKNEIMYCRYIDFKMMPRPSDISKSFIFVRYYCFWVLPPAERPTARFSQAGAKSAAELPTDRHEYARAHNIPGYRELLPRWIGAEK